MFINVHEFVSSTFMIICHNTFFSLAQTSPLTLHSYIQVSTWYLHLCLTYISNIPGWKSQSFFLPTLSKSPDPTPVLNSLLNRILFYQLWGPKTLQPSLISFLFHTLHPVLQQTQEWVLQNISWIPELTTFTIQLALPEIEFSIFSNLDYFHSFSLPLTTCKASSLASQDSDQQDSF